MDIDIGTVGCSESRESTRFGEEDDIGNIEFFCNVQGSSYEELLLDISSIESVIAIFVMLVFEFTLCFDDYTCHHIDRFDWIFSCGCLT